MESGSIRLPQQETPTPKLRMKKLQWSKIPTNKVLGKKNVWTAVGKAFTDYTLNFAEIEELFGISDVIAVTPTDPKDAERKKKSDDVR